MLFNSIDFAVFLPIVFVFYWFVFNKNIKILNLFLVVASYVFYGWWDWRFLFLIALSSFIDFFVGILLSKTDIDYLMSSEELTSFQRVFLELALEKETTPWEMTVGMSEPTQSIHLQSVLKELKKE